MQLAARRIPEIPKADTIVIPAQLARLARQHSGFPRTELATQPTWLSDRDIDIQVEWEHRRHRIASHQPAVTDGLRRLAWLTDRTLELLDPAVVLTTNKIDHPCALSRQAALHSGRSVGLVERSPFDSIWFERDGLFAESRIWSATDWDALESGDDVSRRLVERNPAGFRGSEATSDRPLLDDLPRPIIFVPFDNTLWTGWAQRSHPQRAVDNPGFASAQDAVDDLSDAVGRLGGSLVIKPHPSCLETERLGLPANTYLLDGALDHLLQHADLVAAFNTKVAFVSLAFRRNTATFADNPVAASGLTTHWRDHDSTFETLRVGLDPARRPRSADIDAFFTWLADNYFYGVDPTGPRPPGLLVGELIAEAGNTSHRPSPSTVCKLKQIAAGDAAAIPIRIGPLRPTRVDSGQRSHRRHAPRRSQLRAFGHRTVREGDARATSRARRGGTLGGRARTRSGLVDSERRTLRSAAALGRGEVDRAEVASVIRCGYLDARRTDHRRHRPQHSPSAPTRRRDGFGTPTHHRPRCSAPHPTRAEPGRYAHESRASSRASTPIGMSWSVIPTRRGGTS